MAKRQGNHPENTGQKRGKRASAKRTVAPDNTGRKQRAGAVSKIPDKREPTEKERLAIEAAREAQKHRPARAEFIETPSGEKGALKVEPPHSDEKGHPYLVTETFGSSSNSFVTHCMLQLANCTSTGGKPSLDGLNSSLAIIGAIAPQDEFEAALATQIAATHDLSMEMLRRTKVADRRDAMRDYGNLATKLTRTFTAQMKALSDWRRGGEQVVRHVHVDNRGGQAVVAETVNVGDRKNGSFLVQPHGRIPAMPGENAGGHALSAPEGEGPASLLHARVRSGIGGANGEQE